MTSIAAPDQASWLDGRRPTGNGGDPADDERRFRLFLAEYDSLRQESAQAREAQQSIFQWSIGALAAVIVAVLALQRGSFALRLSMFGFGLPLLAFGAALAWFGELYRMERAGYYIRRREEGWHVYPRPSGLQDPRLGWWPQFPLLWESVIHTGPKLRSNFVTGFCVYLAAQLFSAIVFLVCLWPHRFATSNEALHVLGIGWTLAFVLGYTWLMWRRFSGLKREFPHPRDEQLTDPRSGDGRCAEHPIL